MNCIKVVILNFLLLLIACSLSAQSLVSTDPQPKNVVLEEFTGIHCGYCPDGHAIGKALSDNNPNRVVLVSIHQGTYAVPDEGEPDYRTPWGDSLAIQARVSGYPMGTINRHVFNGSQTALSRGDWTVSASEIMEEISPVNVGVQSTFDSVDRELNIVIELFYTADSPADINQLNIALLQNHIFGPQLGGGAGDEYEHMHMLRDLITGQWGIEINNTSQGSFIRQNYNYNVPEQIKEIPVVIENCEVAVFLNESHQETFTGALVKAINGTNLHIGNVTLVDTVTVKEGAANNITEFIIDVKSTLAGEELFQLILESPEQPIDWESKFYFKDQEYFDTAVIYLEQNLNELISFQIVPGETSGMVKHTVKLRSVLHPEAPERLLEFYVVSNVTDMVVNGTGGPESGYYDYVFSESLSNAGCNSHATISADEFIKGMQDRAFGDLKNLYLNIAWTFPALTIDQIQAVKSFMDNGGNLLISGQDIGWDFMSGAANSHGSPEATEFYQNYLFSEYLNDGNSSNYILFANPNDEVFSNVADAFLIDIYNGNIYPDNIAAREGADEVFYYQSNNKAGVVKVETDTFKMIYLACGFEMIGQVPITNQIMQLTYHWFNNSLSTEEYNGALSNAFIGQNYPNPASEITAIEIDSKDKDAVFKLLNSTGKTIKTLKLEKGQTTIMLNTAELPAGTYFYYLIRNGIYGKAHKLIVAG